MGLCVLKGSFPQIRILAVLFIILSGNAHGSERVKNKPIRSGTWNGLNDQNEKVASGIYFYRLTTSDYSEVRKMTFLK
jgi:hypothetical protein